ncbi:MAG TPA: Asp-tRNA(Asn)/Glu-tRNA(Gln) amidotransferase subunit GatB [Chloroflexia bacterium]|nr:Asp-tRNA(Asn)/Glu-tRNA(Gln) amidotransferase subunit GatB [Chloroflexia bacterium]
MVSTNQTSEGSPVTKGGAALSEGVSTRLSTGEYLTTVGLEVHAQLLTNSKMFCGCSADIAYARPNSHVCPVCLGMPGTLPVINADAVRKTILTGLALNCEIPPFSKFDRKNYHYPDLMKGYQISQYDLPLCINGYLEVEGGSEGSFRVGIRRVHLEEDTARLLHRNEPDSTPYTLMDVNRAGVPLIEIVSEPDITSPEQAQLYLMHLRHILRWIGVSTGNMEEGSFRVDANVSVRPAEQKEYGTRAEVKNMNSFKAVRQALEFEVERQIGVLESGQKVVQETRGWVEARGVTVSQRSKEEAHDYRYFPEPDLPPLTFTEADIEAIRSGLPELPIGRRDRLVEKYGVSAYDATQLTSSRATADYFEEVAHGLNEEQARTAASFIVNDLAKLLAESNTEIEDASFTAESMRELVSLVSTGMINRNIARTLMPDLLASTRTPGELVKERGLAVVRDESALDKAVEEAIQANPKAVADYLGGKESAIAAFLGPIMKATRGQADANATRELLKRKLDALREV